MNHWNDDNMTLSGDLTLLVIKILAGYVEEMDWL